MARCSTPDCRYDVVAFVEGEAYCEHHRPPLALHILQEDERKRLLALIDGCMTTLDWISTTTEGTPKQPFLDIHRRVGEQMRTLNQEMDRLSVEYGD